MKVILFSNTLDGATLCGQAAAVCTASGNPAKSLRAALDSGHESVLEHVSFTFRIEGLSRAALGQLTRHRLASFDVESQRYVKLEDVRMVKNWFEWKRDGKDVPRIHPAQKPVALLKQIIEIFTDPGDVVIDPCAGSGATLRAARELGRHSYGFEVSRDFYNKATEQMLGKAESA